MKNLFNWLGERTVPNIATFFLLIASFLILGQLIFVSIKLDAELAKPPVTIEKKIILSDAYDNCIKQGGNFFAMSNKWDDNKLNVSCTISKEINYSK